ncbi:hypothetical protein [Brevundimonas poindexterae]|uniref:hypothetical protein n=1 Tax=Brevundimonas poindexterae TaxID=74325 RepID=UPI001CFC67B9|nr:hypothetical protein [Brevundimonas poindexterae]
MRLSLTLTGVLCAAATLAVASPTLAQAGGGTPGQSAQQAAGGAIGRLSGADQDRRYESEAFRRGAPEEMTVEEAEEAYGAERVALAERVQALMDAGECREARRVASEAGERAMALRVRQTCRRR